MKTKGGKRREAVVVPKGAEGFSCPICKAVVSIRRSSPVAGVRYCLKCAGYARADLAAQEKKAG